MICENGIGMKWQANITWEEYRSPKSGEDKEWLQIAKPIEELIGCKLIAFDPNFVFRMENGEQCNVPFQFIVELFNMLNIESLDERKQILDRKEVNGK